MLNKLYHKLGRLWLLYWVYKTYCDWLFLLVDQILILTTTCDYQTIPLLTF